MIGVLLQYPLPRFTSVFVMAAQSNEKQRTRWAVDFLFSVLFCISNGRDSPADAGLVKLQRVEMERWNSFQTHSDRSVSSERWRSHGDENRLAHETPVEVVYLRFVSWGLLCMLASVPGSRSRPPTPLQRGHVMDKTQRPWASQHSHFCVWTRWWCHLQLEEEMRLLCYTVTPRTVWTLFLDTMSNVQILFAFMFVYVYSKKQNETN